MTACAGSRTIIKRGVDAVVVGAVTAGVSLAAAQPAPFPHQAVPTRLLMRVVQLNDFDGDGRLDLMMANPSPDDPIIQIAFNRPGGLEVGPELQSPLSLTGTNTDFLDLTGDGLPDLVGVSETSIDCYAALPGGGFAVLPFAQTPLANTSFSYALDRGDFDNDGNIDFLVWNKSDSVADFYFGDGLGGFLQADAAALLNLNSIRSPLVGDFDADGDSDVLVKVLDGPSTTEAIEIYESAGDRSFEYAGNMDYDFNGGVRVERIELDPGMSSLVIFERGLRECLRTIVSSSGAGFFDQQLDFDPCLNRMSSDDAYRIGRVDAIDFDGDGIRDILIRQSDENIIYYRDTSGAIRDRVPFYENEPFDLAGGALIDLDDDGRLDIVRTIEEYPCWFGDTPDNEGLVVTLLNTEDPGDDRLRLPAKSFATKATDFDRDGFMDVLFSDYTPTFLEPDFFMTWYRGSITGEFVFGGSVPLPISPFGETLVPNQFGTGDFDGDGDNDIVGNVRSLGTRVDSNLYYFENLGNEIFAAPVAVSDGIGYATANAFLVIDLDGDGHLDVLSRSLGSGVINRGLGNGQFEPLADVGLLDLEFEIGDLNQDGILDIVSTSRTNSRFSVSLGEPGLVFSDANKTEYTTSGQVTTVLVTNLDLDDEPEILVGLATRKALLAYDVNPDGSLSAATEIQTPVCARIYRPVVGDLNADGYPDIVLSGTAHRVMYGGPDGTFEVDHVSFGTDYGGFASNDLIVPTAMLADLHDDGYPELIELGGVTPNLLSPQRCIPDLNKDGQLNFFDVSTFITFFNMNDARANFEPDNAINFFDIAAFLTSYQAGCP